MSSCENFRSGHQDSEGNFPILKGSNSMSEDRIPVSGGSRRSSYRPPGLRIPIPPREEPFAYNVVPVPLPLPLPPPPPRSAVAAELNPPELNSSELEKEGILGYDSKGKVYKVWHRATQTLYALKVVHGNHDLSTRRQIIREMDILGKTDSPYVVKCHGVYDRGGEIQFVLEYMDGGSLENVKIIISLPAHGSAVNGAENHLIIPKTGRISSHHLSGISCFRTVWSDTDN